MESNGIYSRGGGDVPISRRAVPVSYRYNRLREKGSRQRVLDFFFNTAHRQPSNPASGTLRITFCNAIRLSPFGLRFRAASSS